MSAEAPGVAIASATFSAAEGIASASIGTLSPPAMEGGIPFNPSLGGEISPITVTFNHVEPAVTPLSLDSMPVHVLDIGNLNPDRQVPVPELVFNNRLFKTLAAGIESIKMSDQPAPQNNLLFENSNSASSPFVFDELGIELGLHAETEPAVESDLQVAQKPLEVSDLSEGLLHHMDVFADQKAITDAIATVQDFQIPDSQKAFWLEKFAHLHEEKVGVRPATLVEVSTQTKALDEVSEDGEPQHKLELQTETETAGANPPNAPIEIATDDLNEAEPADFEEPEWDMFKVSPKKVVEQRSLKKRQRVAAEIVDESSSTAANAKASLKLQTEDRLYKLDVPDISETVGIVTGQLEYPPVALAAEYELAKVDESDKGAIYNALQNAVDSAPPTTKKPESSYLGRRKQSKLDPSARELANEGAQHIVLKRGLTWFPVKKSLRKEPLELDKVGTSSD